MKRTIATLLAVTVASACSEGPSAPVAADAAFVTADVSSSVVVNATGDYICTQSVTGTFENIIVPDDASCTVTNARISGNVLAKERSQLALVGSQTQGSVDGAQPNLFHVRGGRVFGSIQVQSGTARGHGVSIMNVVLPLGNVTVEKMNTGSITVLGNRLLDGSLKVAENTTSSALDVSANVIIKNGLEVIDSRGADVKRLPATSWAANCKDNALLFVGSSNSASEFEGQCSR
jgi:hypothetical protein